MIYIYLYFSLYTYILCLALNQKSTIKQIINPFFTTSLYFKPFDINSFYIYIYYLSEAFSFRLKCSLNKRLNYFW